MTAPDPGLTDLIAAHYTWREVDEGGDYLVCACGHYFASRQTWAEHLKLVVEQHTNGRIAELEAGVEHWKDRSQYNYDCGMVLANEAHARAEKAEATIARVEALRDNRRMHDYYGPGQPFVAVYDLRAALEGNSNE